VGRAFVIPWSRVVHYATPPKSRQAKAAGTHTNLREAGDMTACGDPRRARKKLYADRVAGAAKYAYCLLIRTRTEKQKPRTHNYSVHTQERKK